LEITKSGEKFFLARPRRFGKSLLLDTFEELFSCQKELFEGLYIYDKWEWEEKFPVIRIDFSTISSMSSDDLRSDVMEVLNFNAIKNNVSADGQTPSSKFLSLIVNLYKAYGREVVILVDEYDKPVLDKLDAMRETEASRANKELLSNFYSVMKGCGKYIRFIFITGVTKFSGLSIFSGLNNLTDLTLDENFCDVCGYTQKELEANFPGHIKALAEKENMGSDEMLAKIKHWYDGYTWDGKTEMYNPFSTLNLFNKNKFGMYWFSSGPPNYLISYIKQARKLDLFFEKGIASETALMNFNPAASADTTAMALLFQTGYLTIKGKEYVVGDELNYLMDSPNLEVRKSLAKHVLLSYIDESERQEMAGLSSQFIQSALGENAQTFSDTVLQTFVHIPYTISNAKSKDADNEAFYHAMLVCSLISMGFDVTAEKITNLGRADIIWKYQNKVFIIELKFVDLYRMKKSKKTGRRTKVEKTPATVAKEMNKLLDASLAQIKDKKYYESYLLQKKEIILVGIAVSSKAKHVKARFERL
jgi:hypothetical protein